MFINPPANCVKCCFGFDQADSPDLEPAKVDVFYAETRNLESFYPDLKNYITEDEQSRADKFHFDLDRVTFISCRALLRLIIAGRLNTTPRDIPFIKSINNKPGLPGDPVFFNVSHTREAFAIAVSGDFQVGIDLEKINQRIDFHSVIETYFSQKERNFILKSEKGSRDRFFLLWTRKEALLKALGTGITEYLTQVEVSEHENLIDRRLFDNECFNLNLHDYFLYSKKLNNYYLTIAQPHPALRKYYNLNRETIVSLF